MKFHPPVRIFFSTLLASPVKNFQLSRDSVVSGLGRVFNSTRVLRSTFSSAMLRIGTTFLFLFSATGAGWLCRAATSLRRLFRGPVDRLNDCVVHGVPATTQCAGIDCDVVRFFGCDEIVGCLRVVLIFHVAVINLAFQPRFDFPLCCNEPGFAAHILLAAFRTNDQLLLDLV
jgi:hypothetical protein